MRFGIGVDYCLKALIVLAARYASAEPVRVEEIAATANIPENYLRRLLILLKRGNLVASQKGPNGGYMLARHPAEITMADVVNLLEGDYVPVECLEEGARSLCDRGEPCPMRQVWCEVRDTVNAILRRTTLQSLSDQSRGPLYFQI